jgi:hypothetical protein
MNSPNAPIATAKRLDPRTRIFLLQDHWNCCWKVLHGICISAPLVNEKWRQKDPKHGMELIDLLGASRL